MGEDWRSKELDHVQLEGDGREGDSASCQGGRGKLIENTRSMAVTLGTRAPLSSRSATCHFSVPAASFEQLEQQVDVGIRVRFSQIRRHDWLRTRRRIDASAPDATAAGKAQTIGHHSACLCPRPRPPLAESPSSTTVRPSWMHDAVAGRRRAELAPASVWVQQSSDAEIAEIARFIHDGKLRSQLVATPKHRHDPCSADTPAHPVPECPRLLWRSDQIPKKVGIPSIPAVLQARR